MKVIVWTPFVYNLYREIGIIGGIAIQMSFWAQTFLQKGWDVYSISNVENTEINWDKIPTAEAKAKLKETVQAVETCYDSIQIVDSASRVYKKISEKALVPYSWEAFKTKCISIFEKLGI